ncbi:suppressor of fused domain protein [Phytopseudomonas dryadis]|uniref:Suppressor of fused protein (SUFU) n=1 Tax=Phytopseudomonas dryadis TaxID=2487520 RepID=A0ABY1YZ60_9GAMM|nr:MULTISPECIES: suppressor of fused domain protein [Pseudomonas]TBU99004.1 Suppressor of fused protein (SUFU) [Pseudomonas dryadis]TBV11937.1 Suppressor of fused protein (SUFU) [Pseudomonas sp. FRB 230]
MNIIKHAEKFLGKISQGWKEKPSSDGLQVVCFEGSPFGTVDTFMTAGLSYHELRVSDEKKVRQELILPMSGTGIYKKFISLLLFICELILRNHDAVLRGQIIRLPMDAAEKLGFDAVYCSVPMFMSDDFATFRGSQPPTVIVWVIPVYKSEADYVDANGWSKFEDLLEEKDPDLFSLGRDPII